MRTVGQGRRASSVTQQENAKQLIMATPGVGEDIEDICTRCGDTWHVVMAKLGDRVAKVVCKLCGSQHNYRGEKNAPPPPKSEWGRIRRRRSGRSQTAPALAIAEFDPSKPPRGYSPKDQYVAGERVIHATFGVGVVASTPGPGKVDVQFPGGARTLACAKELAKLERPVAVESMSVPDSPAPKSGPRRS
jgi:hypothetical protein